MASPERLDSIRPQGLETAAPLEIDWGEFPTQLMESNQTKSSSSLVINGETVLLPMELTGLDRNYFDNFLCETGTNHPDAGKKQENSDGDIFVLDKNGRINEFVYRDEYLRNIYSFAVLRRDIACNVSEFYENGRTWRRENDKWNYVESDGTPSNRSYDFNISVDQQGIHPTGRDSNILKVPGYFHV